MGVNDRVDPHLADAIQDLVEEGLLDKDTAACAVAQQVVGGGRDEINELAVEGFFVCKRLGVGDGSFRQRGVAPALFRVAAQESQGIVENFPLHGFVNLQLKPTDGNDRRSGSGVRARSHSGDVRGEKNEETSGRAARASGRDVHRYGNARGQNALDDVLHGVAQTAGRIHGDENQGELAALGVRDAFFDISSEDGFDDAVQIQVEDDGGGRMFVGGNGGEKTKEREGRESDPYGWSENHGAPPLGFCKCSSNCLASE